MRRDILKHDDVRLYVINNILLYINLNQIEFIRICKAVYIIKLGCDF